nr:helix-turn-helix transcriptional regulator [Paenibacillus cellulosilyticus]
MIGISQGTISELEKNKFNPSVETMLQLRLYHVYGVLKTKGALMLVKSSREARGV